MNEKALLEQRQELHDEMETILNSAKAENRAMDEKEILQKQKTELWMKKKWQNLMN